jgi:hypothetical protein
MAQIEFTSTGTDRAKQQRIRIAIENVLPPGDWLVGFSGAPDNDTWEMRVRGLGIDSSVNLYGTEGKHSVFEIAEAMRNVVRPRQSK